MKPEQQFYQLLKKYLPGFSERIENVVGAGNPDFHCIWNGRTYWVEVKVTKGKKWKLIDLLEPSQFAWQSRYVNNGGLVFFAVKDLQGVHLFNSPTNQIGFYKTPVDWNEFMMEIMVQLINLSD